MSEKSKEELAEDYLQRVDIPTSKCVSLQTVVGLIEEALLAGREAAIPKWIECRERMPDSGRSVLIYWRDLTNGHSVRVATWWEDENMFAYPCCGHRRIITDITHWMPLPEPPREK